jgi:alcohol dehydrogenase
MQQLYFIKKGKLEWRELNAPSIQDGKEALVRPFSVAKCDLDDAFLFNNIPLQLKIGKALGMIDHGFFKTFGKTFFAGPFPFGHECVGEVIEVGEKVKTLKAGDVVSVPFQISCGTCVHCSLGITSACDKVSPISTYGFGKHLQFGGAMSDLLKVPYADGMLLKIPDSIDPIHLASLSDNVPDAYRAVGPYLEKDNNKSVLIIGGKAKSIAMYCIQIAKALGAKQIVYADTNPERLALAKTVGADQLVENFSEIRSKYDLVVEASSNEKGLRTALNSLNNYGICTSVGIYLKKTSLPLVEMYANGVTFTTGITNVKSNAEKVLDLISTNKLSLKDVTTRLDSWENSIDAFLSKTTKVIVTRERIKSRIK